MWRKQQSKYSYSQWTDNIQTHVLYWNTGWEMSGRGSGVKPTSYIINPPPKLMLLEVPQGVVGHNPPTMTNGLLQRCAGYKKWRGWWKIQQLQMPFFPAIARQHQSAFSVHWFDNCCSRSLNEWNEQINKSMHSEIGPLWQNEIHRTVVVCSTHW